MEHQDWKPVDIGRGKSVKKVNQENSRKVSSYIPPAQGGIREDEEGGTIVNKFSREFIQAVISKRVELKLNQKQLAQRLNYPVDFIKRFEQGKETYNSGIVSKIKKNLGIHVEAKSGK